MRKLLYRPIKPDPWAWRGTDLGSDCPARGEYLRTEMCQIGCKASRAPLPIYACQRFGECCPWKLDQTGKMKSCLECVAGGMQSQCAGCPDASSSQSVT